MYTVARAGQFAVNEYEIRIAREYSRGAENRAAETEKSVGKEFWTERYDPASDSACVCYAVAGSLRVTAEKPLYG